MYEVKDFSNWKIYEGSSEGSGRSEKTWLISDRQEIGLFKYPKFDPQTLQITTEHVSEHLAHQIGSVLGIQTANVDLGRFNNRIGSMSYLVNEPAEALIEGVHFVSGQFPGYDADKLFDHNTGKYYCLDHIIDSTQSFIKNKSWIYQMLLFDFLIGNRDRHQSNWAILASFKDYQKDTIHLRPCPLYDNGSSLCCYVNEQQISRFLGNDHRSVEALVDTKSTSVIRIDGYNKKNPKHSDVIRYLLSQYPESQEYAVSIIQTLSENVINNLLEGYPKDILSRPKNMLIRRFLKTKVSVLNGIMEDLR